MPPCKTAMTAIADDRKRAEAFKSRKEGLMKKVKELAILCGVPVAVVGSNPDGGAPELWKETEKGVLNRYRALPDEKRAQHTHLRYLEDILGKENARLARVRQGGPDALAPPDAELGKMTLEGLHELLESVDAALRATAERRKALGLPSDDDDAGVSRAQHGAPCTGGNFVGLDGYQMPDINDGRVNPAMFNAFQPYNDGTMQPGYCYNTGMMQPAAYDAKYIGGNGVHLDGYQMQMPGIGNDYHGQLASGAFHPVNAIVQPGYGGFQCTDSSYVGNQMQVPGNNGIPDLAMWHTDEPYNAVVPAGYPYMHIGGNCMDTPAAEYPGLVTGDNFLDMGIGGNFMKYVDGYETGCSSNEFQCSATSQNSSCLEELHYLSDVADGMRFGYHDTKLQRWEE